MDETFFQELDSHISNIGSDKIWKRTIGDIEIWFTPISYTGQGKAMDKLLSDGEGTLAETKRLSLANSIVGIGQFDLRKYRHAGPVFPIWIRDEEGKRVQAKVDLQKYVYDKISGWDSEFVDVAYKVFADLMEGHSKFLVKDIKFENLKSPTEELAELDQRVAELRDSLGLPQLVEPEKILSEEEIEARAAEQSQQEEQEEDAPPQRRSPPERRASHRDFEEPELELGQEMKVDFNPFETSGPPEAQREEDPPPVRSVPIPKPPAKDPKQMSPIERELLARGARPHQPATIVGASDPPPPQQRAQVQAQAPANTPATAHAALPSVDVGVLEEPGRRERVAPPSIDRSTTAQSANPRFQRPGSGGAR